MGAPPCDRTCHTYRRLVVSDPEQIGGPSFIESIFRRHDERKRPDEDSPGSRIIEPEDFIRSGQTRIALLNDLVEAGRPAHKNLSETAVLDPEMARFHARGARLPVEDVHTMRRDVSFAVPRTV